MKIKFLLNGSCFFLSILSFNSLFSQEWRIEKTLKANDSLSLVTLRYTTKDQGIAAIDPSAKVKWEIPSPGLVLGMGIWKGDLIAFYTLEHKDLFYRKIKDIHALLIGLKQHRILSDQVVYTNKSKYFVVPLVVNDPSENFSLLLIRRTNEKGDHEGFFSEFGHDKKSETSALTAILLGDDLKPQSREISSSALGNTFISACAGLQKDFYLVGASGDQLVAEKYDEQGKADGKLTAPFSPRDESRFEAVIHFDRLDHAVDLVLAYENSYKKRAMRGYRFDMEKQKAYPGSEDILDKDYTRQIKYGQLDQVRSSNLKRIEDLKPIAIEESADRILVVKEIRYIYSTGQRDAAPRYTFDDAIISIYDKEFQIRQEVVLDKTCESFIPTGGGLGVLLKDGKLLVVTSETAGIATYQDHFYSIDAETGAVQRKTIDRKGISKSHFLNAPNALWFSHNYVVPMEEGFASVFKTKFETTLVAQSY